ncbi:probable xyloglucan endotransglucosylase/hydrolase protein 33 [Mercurialis annua]|uniref:probable xyloglucan endotransglucosylase/hydrolase protein 33 n=1 Tax=Mercurialis annua TaxID=3986 RepID=UPI002160AE9B|nr:probable xyloglucan endotransglucosylase/hydrolase protein 33 [Mercurialis annua]
MALLQQTIVLGISLLCMTLKVSSHSRHSRYTPPKVTPLTNLFSPVSIPQEFSTSFGASNVKLLNNGSYATLVLDKSSGSGLASKNKYYDGFFSAAVKLPAGLTSGVVVAFYMSNAESYPHNHDEIDIELLGHDKRNDWVIQTNVYANGSTSTGREEKFYLWFDPTAEHHYYTIIWNTHHIVFLVDNIPVREFTKSNAYPSIYPSKPMSVYATIWDGSEWATKGGKYPVNYKYSPFLVSFSQMQLTGCTFYNPSSSSDASNSSTSCSNKAVEGEEFVKLSKDQTLAMDWARKKLMFYSYCNDKPRFKVLPPECK